MSEINKILDVISIINDIGDISFKKYSKSLFNQVEELVVFNNPNRVDSLHKVKLANSNMRCDSLKSLMIINKLSKFL